MAKKYNLVATNTECYFDTDTLNLESGKHTFVVKAKAEGFTDSEYSNEVEVNVSADNGDSGDSGNGYTLTAEFSSSAGDCRLFVNGEEVEPNGTYYHVTTYEVWTTNPCVISCKNDNWQYDEYTHYMGEDIRQDGLEMSGSGVITLTEDESIYVWQK